MNNERAEMYSSPKRCGVTSTVNLGPAGLWALGLKACFAPLLIRPCEQVLQRILDNLQSLTMAFQHSQAQVASAACTPLILPNLPVFVPQQSKDPRMPRMRPLNERQLCLYCGEPGHFRLPFQSFQEKP